MYVRVGMHLPARTHANISTHKFKQCYKYNGRYSYLLRLNCYIKYYNTVKKMYLLHIIE